MKRLEHLPVSVFVIVMGLAGLSLAWRRAARVLGAPALAGQALYWLAVAVFAVVVTAYLLKWSRHPRAARAELGHPVRIAFVPTITVAVLLLATAGEEILPQVSVGLWWVGAVGHLAATLAVMAAWMRRPDILHSQVTPAWFIPIVGNLVTPLAGPRIGSVELSWLAFSVGVVFWLALLPVVMSRLIIHDPPLPALLLPTTAILIAPPAVALLAYQSLLPGEFGAAGRVLFYVAVFFALFLATMLPQLARLRFGMPWWAYSFPLAALATATQAAASAIGGSPLQVLSWLALWLATVVIAGLSTLTARSLARGTLLVAEAGPGRPPERAKADVAADPAR